MKPSLLFLLLLVSVVAVLPAAATAAAVYGGSKPTNNTDDPRASVRYGGWRLIHNIDDPEIQGLGEWAVSNSGLKFVRNLKVVSGEEQPVSGTNYCLVIQAITGNGENVTYKARMYDPWRPNALKLVSFRPSNCVKLIPTAGLA